jgi:RhtB (resistance to homoserine/threonine) family protein
MFEFLTLTCIIILAAISPGPDFAIVMRNSLAFSRQAGVMTAAGVATSLLIHAGYCILGLGILISKTLFLFNIIKYMGAGYLIYLGIKGLLAHPMPIHPERTQHKKYFSDYHAFRAGLLCNLLNPKAILFLVAFFTLVIHPATPWYYQVVIGIEMSLITFMWFSLVAIFLTHRKVQKLLEKIQHYIVKVFGVFLIFFGIKIAFVTNTGG